MDKSHTIDDLVERCSAEEKLYFLQGRQPKLAFRPNSSLTLSWDDIDLEKIKDFCRSSQSKGNLIIGFLSYDLGLYTHKIKPKNKTKFPLAHIYSFTNWVEEDNGLLRVKYRDGKFLKSVKNILNTPKRSMSEVKAENGFQPTWSLKQYEPAFNKVKQYIRSGDIYQLNLSYPLTTTSKADAKDIFAKVKKSNQVDMAGLFQSPKFGLISFSPETFVNIQNRRIETFPIKGTRAKKKNVSDKLIVKDLTGDKKEQAELNMISDLLRNDLSIVCEPASVNIKSRQSTTKLSRVIHTFSHITGELHLGVSSVEALLKIFPGGSISGCPKKRALEIIDEAEQSARGPYTGALFTLDAEDNLQASILIRTLVKEGQSISLSVGGGIVFDSELKSEYQETLDKSLSITKAF